MLPKDASASDRASNSGAGWPGLLSCLSCAMPLERDRLMTTQDWRETKSDNQGKMFGQEHGTYQNQD